MSFDPEGAVKPSSIEAACFNKEISALNCYSIPYPQKRIEYSGTNPIYVGISSSGVGSSNPYWTIQKITYSGDSPTLIQTAYGAWDSRASLSYS